MGSDLAGKALSRRWGARMGQMIADDRRTLWISQHVSHARPHVHAYVEGGEGGGKEGLGDKQMGTNRWGACMDGADTAAQLMRLPCLQMHDAKRSS
eukprot:253188-Chlamydomonas_euryale.AAC.1